MTVNEGRADDADTIIDTIAAHKSAYKSIMEATGVPWQIVGVLHSMECGLRFDQHLHNGDPLNRRTVHAPPGRPVHGSPPFTFVESAIDALQYDHLAGLTEWGLAETLYRMERYNGMGYRKTDIVTPYLWSFSNHYRRGKYVEVKKNGEYVPVFDADLVSEQCGAAVLLRRLVDRGLLSFESLPRAMDVFINDTRRSTVAAFLLRDNSWIAPRPLTKFVAGFSIVDVISVSPDQLEIKVSYTRPTAPPTTHPEIKEFKGRMFHGQGHVDASDLVADFLGLELKFEGKTAPNRLLITIPAA
jgi:lysozyme family protein